MSALLGIDCATQPAKVGLALGELRDGVVRITKCRTASRTEPPARIAADWLSAYDRALVALDAPLGWARALGASLRPHRAGAPMNAKSDELFKRATDVDIRQRMGKRPLEVGANLISRTAVAALELLKEIRQLTGHTIPLAWAPDEAAPFRAIEVYPAATRLAHGAPDSGGSLKGLERYLDVSAVHAEALQSADAADAAVCALAAADFLLGHAIAPTDQEVAVIEGWIWVPDGSLGG